MATKLCSYRTFTRLPSVILRAFSTSQHSTIPQTINQHSPQTLDDKFRIELVDSDLWGFSFSSTTSRLVSDDNLDFSKPTNNLNEELPDFDDIEDMRYKKTLFYKLDRGSKEFQEYNLDFHRRGSSKRSRDRKARVSAKEEALKLEKQQHQAALRGPVCQVWKEEQGKSDFVENVDVGMKMGDLGLGKKVRVSTFNQMTDQYHLPFCLDIYVSKGSVRACVIHRVSSKVVAVAHSISKDMKFDLKSRKDASACAAVGGVLAQRALEDDIHNVVYTPRKGEKIEGKIQIVLQSIIDHGVDVKVKLKQKRTAKLSL